MDREPVDEARHDALRGLWRHPGWVLLGLVLLMTLPTLWSRDYWAFDEVRHADALRHLLEDGHWFSLHMNGQPYPDKPPVYFWLAGGAAKLLGTDGPAAFFLVSAFGGLVFLLATYALGRTLGGDRRIPLVAAGLVMLTVLFQLLLRTTRMDLLFGGIIVFAWVAIWRGLQPSGSRGWMVLGLALGGLATLVKGPVGLAFPVGALLAWCLWTGRLRRLLGWDVLVGLVLGVAWIALWMVGIGLTEGWDYLHDTLKDQVVGRTLKSHKHSQPFFFYLLIIPAAFVPWTALVSTVPWGRALGLQAWRERLRARRDDARASTWCWVCFSAALVLLSLATSKLFIYAMPLLAPLAALSASWMLRLERPDRDRFLKVLGILMLGAGLGLLVAPWVQPFEAVSLPVVPVTALLFLAGGLLLVVTKARRLALAMGLLFAANLAAALEVIPRFDPIMSPRRQAEHLARLIDQGHAPLVYMVYPGTYSYYARRVIPETKDRDVLRRHLATHEKVVIATGKHEPIQNVRRLLGDLEVVDEQRIEGSPFVLLIRPAAGGAPPR